MMPTAAVHGIMRGGGWRSCTSGTPTRTKPRPRRGCRRTGFTHDARASPENARTVASLIHATDRFRRPRTESLLTSPKLAAIAIPTMFITGADAATLSAERARPSIEQIPTPTRHELPGGHGPWLVDPGRSATHLARIAATER
jgi:pimeloyl-ACP methyl ester carboxylesterase